MKHSDAKTQHTQKIMALLMMINVDIFNEITSSFVDSDCSVIDEFGGSMIYPFVSVETWLSPVGANIAVFVSGSDVGDGVGSVVYNIVLLG